MQTLDRTAKVCHQANKAHCENMGDFSQLNWEDISPEAKLSVRDGIMKVIENTEMTPADLHENWISYRERQGWKYGEVKDEEFKTHPKMIPFDKLEQVDKVKDILFINIVKSMNS